MCQGRKEKWSSRNKGSSTGKGLACTLGSRDGGNPRRRGARARGRPWHPCSDGGYAASHPWRPGRDAMNQAPGHSLNSCTNVLAWPHLPPGPGGRGDHADGRPLCPSPCFRGGAPKCPRRKGRELRTLCCRVVSISQHLSPSRCHC